MMKKAKIEIGKNYLIKYKEGDKQPDYWYEHIIDIQGDKYCSEYINKEYINDSKTEFIKSALYPIEEIISAKEISKKEWNKLMLLRII